jgi:peptidylprolyl isomerase
MLNQMEAGKNNGLKQTIFLNIINKPENAALKQKFVMYQQKASSDPVALDSLHALSLKIEPQIDAQYEKEDHFKFSPEQRKIYTTIGGAPHLDGEYTIFGEVTEGLDVIDKIAAVQCDKNDRPLQDVRIISMEIVN